MFVQISLYSKQEYLTSRYAWLYLTNEQLEQFLKVIIPDLDEQGKPIGDNDEFKVVRMFFVSNVNILEFGLKLFALILLQNLNVFN